MPCRCDGYETESDKDEVEDLTMRLCRAQSVIRDMYEEVGENPWDPSFLKRINREIKELEKHKAEEAAADDEAARLEVENAEGYARELKGRLELAEAKVAEAKKKRKQIR